MLQILQWCIHVRVNNSNKPILTYQNELDLFYFKDLMGLELIADSYPLNIASISITPINEYKHNLKHCHCYVSIVFICLCLFLISCWSTGHGEFQASMLLFKDIDIEQDYIRRVDPAFKFCALCAAALFTFVGAVQLLIMPR